MITEEQAKALKPGDKLRLVNLPEFSRQHEGQIVTFNMLTEPNYYIDDPGMYLVFEEKLCFDICDLDYVEITLKQQECGCDLIQLLRYGCQCGGS